MKIYNNKKQPSFNVNQVSKGLIKLFTTIHLTLFTLAIHADITPDALQVEDKINPDNKVEGVFNLKNEATSIVSMATGELLGHTPGIRSVATVNNNEGLIHVCSTVNVNYQIVDIDGDWDNPYTIDDAPDGQGGTYVHLGTKDSITWWAIDENGNRHQIDVDELGGNPTKIMIPQQLTIAGIKRSAIGYKLAYQITPFTMLGSVPFTLSTPDPVDVVDITKAYFLAPTQLGPDAIAYEPDFVFETIKQGELSFMGMGALNEQEQFIADATLMDAGDNTTCKIPNSALKKRFKMKAFDENGEPITRYSSGRFYDFALLYDKTGDKSFTLADDISSQVFAKGVKTIDGHLWQDSVRLEYWQPKDYQTWERETLLTPEVTVGGVTKAGLPLSGPWAALDHFDITDNRVLVYTGGRRLIPELLWLHPLVKERYNNNRDKATTVQGYVLRIMFDIPEGDYAPYPSANKTDMKDDSLLRNLDTDMDTEIIPSEGE